MLALVDYKSTSPNASDRDINRVNTTVDRLIVYLLSSKHSDTLYENIARYCINRESRFTNNTNGEISSYENKIREMRYQATLAIWNCTSRASILNEIEAYQIKRSQLFHNATAFHQEHDAKMSALNWNKSKLLKSIKPYKIKLILPWGTYEIDCRSDQYILDAALDNGISLPFNSRAGVDPSSTALLVSGSVDQSEQSFLDRDQMSMGFVLIDVAYPKSDCTIMTHMEELLYKTMPISMTGDIGEVVIIGEKPYTPDPNTNPDPKPDPDPDNPNGGGTVIIPNPPLNPCNMATWIANIPNLATYIKELLENAKKSNSELGMVITSKQICTPHNGNSEFCFVDMPLNTYITTMIHSHPNQCGGIFSAGDIKAMWEAYRTKHADPTSFNYGVATSYNTVYFLCIADAAKFTAFAKQWGLTTDYKALENHFISTFGDEYWDLNSYQLETTFLQLLDNAGLMLFTKISDDDYDPLTRDGLGNPITIRC
jgi:ferredoxin